MQDTFMLCRWKTFLQLWKYIWIKRKWGRKETKTQSRLQFLALLSLTYHAQWIKKGRYEDNFIYNVNWSIRPTTVSAGSDHYFHTECPSIRTSVRPSQNSKIKRQSLQAGTVGWPNGSLMTPVLYIILWQRPLIEKNRLHNEIQIRDPRN